MGFINNFNAAPDKTPCEQNIDTDFAPDLTKAAADLAAVPPVSIVSSINKTCLFLTFPLLCNFETLGFGLLCQSQQIGISKFFANLLARSSPLSGDAIIKSFLYFLMKYCLAIGAA